MINIRADKHGATIIRSSMNESWFECLRSFQYVPPKKPKGYDSLENTHKPYPINAAFALYTLIHMRVPSADQLWSFYCNMYKDDRFRTGFKGGGDAEHEEYRVKRSYPSLVRDFHLVSLLNNDDRFDGAEYDLEMDFKGIDIILGYKGVRFSLCLFVATKLAYSQNARKSKYRNYDLPTITIPMDGDQQNKNVVGGIWLYSSDTLDLIEFHCERYKKE